jgi:hypothetical protein
MISYRKRFIFIHNYKVAGTSIAKALEQYAFHHPLKWLMRVLNTRMGIQISMPYYKFRDFPLHIKARELKDELPERIFESFYKFAFVRNPWDWQVSLYFFMLQTPTHFQHGLVREMTFDQYIEWRVAKDLKLQRDFVMDEGGNQIVDFVGRYERLGEDFRHVCDVLNLETILPHVNSSTRRDYRLYYSDRARELVKTHFAEDIGAFGYAFDDGVHRGDR